MRLRYDPAAMVLVCVTLDEARFLKSSPAS